jgi:hypothetical protein
LPIHDSMVQQSASSPGTFEKSCSAIGLGGRRSF